MNGIYTNVVAAGRTASLRGSVAVRVRKTVEIGIENTKSKSSVFGARAATWKRKYDLKFIYFLSLCSCSSVQIHNNWSRIVSLLFCIYVYSILFTWEIALYFFSQMKILISTNNNLNHHLKIKGIVWFSCIFLLADWFFGDLLILWYIVRELFF